MDEGYKRHHHHPHRHHKVHAQPVSGERRHPKEKRPTTKISGDYEIQQSKLSRHTKGQHRHDHQNYNDEKFSNTNDDLHPTMSPESEYYGEYKFDDGKMTVEDNGT